MSSRPKWSWELEATRSNSTNDADLIAAYHTAYIRRGRVRESKRRKERKKCRMSSSRQGFPALGPLGGMMDQDNAVSLRNVVTAWGKRLKDTHTSKKKRYGKSKAPRRWSDDTVELCWHGENQGWPGCGLPPALSLTQRKSSSIKKGHPSSQLRHVCYIIRSLRDGRRITPSWNNKADPHGGEASTIPSLQC
jgi:hypothetical protein